MKIDRYLLVFLICIIIASVIPITAMADSQEQQKEQTGSVSAALVATTGSLSISSTPSGATIVLDETTMGTTPTTLNSISVGSHVLVLKKSGYDDYSTPVIVNSGTMTVLSFTLAPVTGSISVDSIPSRATIILDGTDEGITPANLTEISVGNHTLVLEKSGYLDYTANITVSAGNITRISATLKSATGSISVKSTPSKATIVLDGTTKGTTPANLNGISVGSHTLVLKKSGYNDYSTTVTVSSGNTTSISASLITTPGSISVRSTPSGASIVLDGVIKGTTPANLTGISVGKHVLVLKKSGYNDYSTTVTISSGKITSVSATLTVSTASLIVNSKPSGATIILDGTAKGTTPANITGLSQGTHTLILKKSGYDDYSTTVTVSSGKTTSITATLKSATGTISINSTPSGATIVLDETLHGTTPNNLTEISVGAHTLVLKKSGYNDYSTTVTVSSGNTTRVSANLSASTGSISVSSIPPGATIILDGTTRGITPANLTGVSTGIHSLVLKKSGYDDYSANVTVNSGKTTIISATLAVSNGLVSINSTPSGATIILDGTTRGITPASFSDVSVGKHTLVLKKSGYDDYTTTVTVSSGKSTRVSATLVVSTGSINIRSTPSGATILLDGMTRGSTPIIITGISTGTHNVVLKKSGYTDYSTDVKVNKGQTSSVSAILQNL
jgi:hypothetical protein